LVFGLWLIAAVFVPILAFGSATYGRAPMAPGAGGSAGPGVPPAATQSLMR
jgi:hypothetical protein